MAKTESKHSKKEEVKKGVSAKKVLLILLSVVIVITGAIFGAAYYLYGRDPDVLLPYTKINGIDVSGLTAKEAEDKLSEDVRGKSFCFVYGNSSYTVPMSSLDFDHSVEPVLKSRKFYDPVRSLFRIEKAYQIPMNPASSEEFLTEIKNLALCNNEGKAPTKDAYVDLSDFEFRTVKEEIGTQVDPERVRDIALSCISEGTHVAHLNEEDIVVLPRLVADSDEFRDRLKYCQDNLNFKVECEINGETTLITPAQIEEMASYEEDKPKLNKKKIEAFATEFASRYNEYNKDYAFKTTGGRNITVHGVTYGKVVDKAGLISDLSDALKGQVSGKIDVSWAQTTYSGGDTIGNSYIEVSIDQQHVWCYKNGKLVVDCDCVTGAPGHDTARGLFIILYVTGPTVLRGPNGDGTNYESPVNCFMPFYGGQGFHGSNGWRSQWGGNIYKTGGSHGCVNCPDAAAKKMADTVGYGYPVVIY